MAWVELGWLGWVNEERIIALFNFVLSRIILYEILLFPLRTSIFESYLLLTLLTLEHIQDGWVYEISVIRLSNLGNENMQGRSAFMIFMLIFCIYLCFLSELNLALS